MSGQVLIVDDDLAFARALARRLRQAGHDTVVCATGAEALDAYAESEPDVVVLDYQLPDRDGLGLLQEMRAGGTGSVFMLATAFPEVEIAVEAMRRGAFDFLSKGREVEECMVRVERGIEVALLRRRMVEGVTGRGSSSEKDLLIGESAAMQKLRARMQAVAASSDTTVAILGETGTGKGVVAQMIHAQSPRAYDPFLAVDCTTIPTTLMESELFGHDKGAFSGAVSAKQGMVEAAHRGTLFIDEVGELPLAMQGKLLRLLEEREFTRVGSTRTRKMEARVITATNRNLETEVASGRFRADLRYRLEVFLIETPPLRNRGDDVFLLTAHFIAERSRALGKPEPRLDSKVIELLQKYTFPGNVRELRNMVDQAVLLARSDELGIDEFPVLARQPMEWPAPRLRQASLSRPAEAATAAPALSPDAQTSPPPSPAMTGGAETDPPLPLPPPSTPATAEPPSPKAHRSLKQIREDAQSRALTEILQTLEEHGGNVSATARALGRSRYQIIRALKKHGLH